MLSSGAANLTQPGPSQEAARYRSPRERREQAVDLVSSTGVAAAGWTTRFRISSKESGTSSEASTVGASAASIIDSGTGSGDGRWSSRVDTSPRYLQRLVPFAYETSLASTSLVVPWCA